MLHVHVVDKILTCSIIWPIYWTGTVQEYSGQDTFIKFLKLCIFCTVFFLFFLSNWYNVIQKIKNSTIKMTKNKFNKLIRWRPRINLVIHRFSISFNCKVFVYFVSSFNTFIIHSTVQLLQGYNWINSQCSLTMA